MNSHSKSLPLVIALIAIVIAVGGYWYATGGVQHRALTTGASDQSQLPNNPHITYAQRPLFTDKITAVTSEKNASRYVATAVNTSVSTTTVVLGPNCQPNTPSLRMYPDRKVVFRNTADVAQEVIFGPKHVTIGARGMAALSVKDIIPDYKPANSIRMRSYTCAGSKLSAVGFLVFFPD